MNKNPECDYEPVVIKSLKSGFSSAETTAHIESCTSCREAAKVVRFFQVNSANEAKPKKLPAAGLIWWKARLRERQRAAEQISKPIFYVQLFATVLFGGVSVWLYNGGWLKFLALDRLFNSIDKIFVPLITGTLIFSFVCLILIFTLRRYLLEK